MANFNVENIKVEDGRFSGVVVTDTFSVRMADGMDRSVSATWNVDITVDAAVRLLWGDAKVKMRAARLKKLTVAELDALNDGVHEVEDYLTAQNESASAQVKALKAKLDEQRDAAIKQFMEKALKEAIEELGEDATHEQRAARGAKIFDEQYAPIINTLYPVGG